MTHRSIHSRLSLTLSCVTLALLTACGGGGEEAAPVVATSPVVAPPPQATPAAMPVCDMTGVATPGPELFNLLANQTAQINGYEARVTLLTSPAGYSYAGLTIQMTVPMPDMRGALSPGFSQQETPNRMGVEMSSLLAPGSVGCVAGVTRVMEESSTVQVVWSSGALPRIPLDQLPASAINGFEFTNNFASTNATAVFRLSKSSQSDSGPVRICHVGTSVTCFTPSVTDDDTLWTFRLPITQPGIYMLSAPAAPSA